MEVTVKTQCIQDLFEVRAEEAPDRSAAVFEGRSLSYGELNRKANLVARELRKLGVGPEVLAAIFVERSAEMVAGLLGILKAGGAYLPMDPSYPTERLEFMLSDSQAPVLVTEQRLAQALPQHNQRVLFLDKLLEQDAGEPCGNPPRTAGPNNLAYVIYTSGSTGKPKGVQVEHRSVLNILSSLRREPGLTGRDVLLAVTTISFDMSLAEIFLPLSAGAQVVIAGSETAGDGHLLSKLLAESGATVMQATPAGWRLLLDSGWEGVSGLKVLCGAKRSRGSWPAAFWSAAVRSGICTDRRKPRSIPPSAG